MIPNASRNPSGTAISTRYQPGPVQRERGWWTGAWACRGAVAVVMCVLLSGLKQILYERIDLGWTKSRLEILRHYALREPRFDLGIRILDRLLDEGLALRGDRVELRPDRTRRPGIRERVAGSAAAIAGEDGLALSGGRGLAAAARGSAAATGCLRAHVRLDPLLVALRSDDRRADAHRGVAHAAELGADNLVV